MNTNHTVPVALMLLTLVANTPSNAAVAFSQRVVDREPIYSAGPGDQADNFTLTSSSVVTGVRFWGGYGIAPVPAEDQFSVSFCGDSGLSQPQQTALCSFSLLHATRNPTSLSTWPGDPVFQYDLVLPQPVTLQGSTRYYLSVNHLNGTWGWSGAGIGNFWYRSTSNSPWVNSYPGNPHHLSFELLAAANESVPPPLVLAGTLRWGVFQLLQLTWTNNGVPCVLEGTDALTGGWTTVSTPWATNANWVSTIVASPNSAQFYRLRRN
jgi:hypothetical protein